MIVYFADRTSKILGLASTEHNDMIPIFDDVMSDDVETGTKTFEFDIGFDSGNRIEVEKMAEVGNYVFRHVVDTDNFFTIIEATVDVYGRKIRVYCEDAGLDLINSIAPAYTSQNQKYASEYINMFIEDTGFVIGRNEVPTVTHQLSWDDSETVSERILDIAKKFGNFEVAYRFKINGTKIVKKYIDIFEKRGSNSAVTLRVGRDIRNITLKKSIENLATALQVTGGIPKNAKDPITLMSYVYDDGDFYLEGSQLRSRKANERWSRFKTEDSSPTYEGYIVQKFSGTATVKSTLLEQAKAKLKKLIEPEVNYDIELMAKPDNISIGDRIRIVDEEGELWLSSRVLTIDVSETKGEWNCTVGENKILKSGIAKSVQQLADEFAKTPIQSPTPVLRIRSNKGQVFSGTEIEETDLDVVILVGDNIVSDIVALQESFGEDTVLRWYEKFPDVSDDWIVISADDERIVDSGFKLQLTLTDLSQKHSFKCKIESESEV